MFRNCLGRLRMTLWHQSSAYSPLAQRGIEIESEIETEIEIEICTEIDTVREHDQGQRKPESGTEGERQRD